MNYLMFRTYDHAGYYETRLSLMVVSLAIAAYFLYYRRDGRFLIMFMSGAFFLTLAEYALQSAGLRGAGYSFSIFGILPPRMSGPVIQGLLEGGVCGLMAFWFADLRSGGAAVREWIPFLALCALTLGLGFVVGGLAAPRAISSARPIFAPLSIIINMAIIFASLLIAWRRDALPALTGFLAGLMIFTLICYEPLHLMGARYIGFYSGLDVVPARPATEFGIMLLTDIFELSGGRLHYFMIPAVFGLVGLLAKEDKSRERYSIQQLKDLTDRGWRRRSNPFRK